MAIGRFCFSLVFNSLSSVLAVARLMPSAALAATLLSEHVGLEAELTCPWMVAVAVHLLKLVQGRSLAIAALGMDIVALQLIIAVLDVRLGSGLVTYVSPWPLFSRIMPLTVLK
jgi:hypothetical protein